MMFRFKISDGEPNWYCGGIVMSWGKRRQQVMTGLAGAAGLLILLGVNGCRINLKDLPVVQGSGVIKTEKRTVAAFSRIDIGSTVKLEFTVGTETKVEATADDNLLPMLVTEVSGDTLKIYINGNTMSGTSPTVRITAPHLAGIAGGGATHGNLAGLNETTFKVKVEGASQITLSGKVDKLDIECAGAGKVLATKLEAQDVKVEAGGAATVEVKAAKTLEGKAAGASTVRNEGAAANKVRASDAARVIAK
jgi:hypothetical protein